MALITIVAVVHIPADSLVLLVCLIFGVAVRASEHGEIRRVGVAGVTHAIRPAMIRREIWMIEDCSLPRGSVVARLAGRREAGRDVVRIGRVLVILLVAAIAVRRQICVVVVNVALIAGQSGVRASQGEGSIVVVESRWDPSRGVVAHIAGRGIARLHVIWIIRFVEIIQMASDTLRVVQLVISIHVTLRALQGGMRTSERETGAGMVERGSQPVHGRVAGVAGGRESGLHMIRICGSIEILHMAGGTCPAVQVVVPVHVALGAWQGLVRSGQSKSRAVVIEGGIAPRGGVVALLASGGEFGLRMVGIGRAVVILHVAGVAGVAGQVVVPIHVTLGALQAGMAASQRKSDRTVIEVRRLPRVRAVAGLTSLRKIQGDVVGVLRFLIVGQVAAHAIGWRSFELVAYMAGGAIQSGVNSS